MTDTKHTFWTVEARDKQGRTWFSWHSNKEEAKKAAANQRGRYPFGNRVRVIPPSATSDNPRHALADCDALRH